MSATQLTSPSAKGDELSRPSASRLGAAAPVADRQRDPPITSQPIGYRRCPSAHATGQQWSQRRHPRALVPPPYVSKLLCLPMFSLLVLLLGGAGRGAAGRPDIPPPDAAPSAPGPTPPPEHQRGNVGPSWPLGPRPGVGASPTTTPPEVAAAQPPAARQRSLRDSGGRQPEAYGSYQPPPSYLPAYLPAGVQVFQPASTPAYPPAYPATSPPAYTTVQPPRYPATHTPERRPPRASRPAFDAAPRPSPRVPTADEWVLALPPLAPPLAPPPLAPPPSPSLRPPPPPPPGQSSRNAPSASADGNTAMSVPSAGGGGSLSPADLGTPICSLGIQPGGPYPNTVLPGLTMSGGWANLFPSSLGFPSSAMGGDCGCGSPPYRVTWGAVALIGNRQFYPFRLDPVLPAPPAPASRGQLSSLVIQIDPARAASCYQVDPAARAVPGDPGPGFMGGLWFRPNGSWTGKDPVGISVRAAIGYSASGLHLELTLNLTDLRKRVMTAVGLASPLADRRPEADPLTRGVFLIGRCTTWPLRRLCTARPSRDSAVTTCVVAYVFTTASEQAPRPPPPPSPPPALPPPAPSPPPVLSAALSSPPQLPSPPFQSQSFPPNPKRARQPPPSLWGTPVTGTDGQGQDLPLPAPPPPPQPALPVAILPVPDEPLWVSTRSASLVEGEGEVGGASFIVETWKNPPLLLATPPPAAPAGGNVAPTLSVCYSLLATDTQLLPPIDLLPQSPSSPPPSQPAPPPDASPPPPPQVLASPPPPAPVLPSPPGLPPPSPPPPPPPSPAPPSPSPPPPSPPPSPNPPTPPSPPSPAPPSPQPPLPPSPSPPAPPPPPQSPPNPTPPSPPTPDPPSPSPSPSAPPPPSPSPPTPSPILALPPDAPRLPAMPPGLGNVPDAPASDLSPLSPPASIFSPPSPPGANVFNETAKCSVTNSGNVWTDGEQFPYGIFRSSVCSCNASPYGIRFESDMDYKNITYHTFRLYNKTCDETARASGAPVCATIRPNINKIAFRIDSAAAVCYNNGNMTGVEVATNYRGVRFWPTNATAPSSWLPARVGITSDGRHIELYLYGLKSDYTGGTFMLTRCAAMGSFQRVCKRTAEGLCLFAFVDTPEHRFVTICKPVGLN